MTRMKFWLHASVKCMNRFHLWFSGIFLSCILVLFAPVASGQMTEKVLYQFVGDSNGAVSSLIRDSAGNLYGTTFDGGSAGVGSVFKVDPTGTQTVVYSFTGVNGDGAHPLGGVTMDSLGNLYGTTTGAGGGEAGIVFKVDPTGKETILHTFSSFSTAAGANPQAGVIIDSAGNLYGTTGGGGAGSCTAPPNITEGCGFVFKLDTAGNETVLLSFTGSADGGNPLGGLVMDSLGNLYGTTSDGGAGNAGTVFKLDPTGHETVLHAFTGTGGDGADPQAALVMDGAGNLYGTTPNGGTAAKGVVFKVDSTGHETVLYSFTGTAGDGASPQAAVTIDSSGNLYGTTLKGGKSGHGTIFKVDSTSQESVLHSFAGTIKDGSQPQTALLRDQLGDLYGTTWLGGADGGGTIFKLDPANQETLLYSFAGPNGDGGFVVAGLAIDSAGNLYGTASEGGTSTNGISNGRSGDGIVFKLDPTGKETVLHSFDGGNGASPKAALIQDSAGDLYGTTNSGGHISSPTCSQGCGTIFKMSTAGAETVLYRFLGGADGGSPQARLLQDSKGNLYGTTTNGGSGSGNCGTVFKLATNDQFHTFTAAPCGSSAGLIADSAGNLYGTMGEKIFKLDSKGKLTVLYTFPGGSGDGINPVGDLVMDSVGNIYGATSFGGTGCSSPFISGCGTVFKLSPTGQETVLYKFTGINGDGYLPSAGVIIDGAGNLYGTTSFGGAANLGTVFKVDPTGNETVSYSFTGLNGDGSNPQGGLIMDSAGKLYGTTPSGGKNTSCVVLLFGAPSVGGCGTVFVVTP